MNDMHMDDTRQMLADSARTYVARAYDAGTRSASLDHPHACAPQRWQEFADMGWLALPFSEPDGGLGGSLADLCAVAEELGTALVVEPFVPCVVLGAGLLADLAPEAVRASWVPGILQGRQRLAFAGWEPGSGFDVAAIRCTAHPDGPRMRLQGDKCLVPGGAGVDGYLVSARLQGSDDVGVFLLAPGTSGLTVTPQALYDGQLTVALAMQEAQADGALMIGTAAAVLPRLQQAVDRAMLAHCAETVGSMQRAFDITLDYLKTRKQFGRVIAANQVVQHRLVDLYVEIAEARAITHAAAEVLDGADRALHRRHSAAARICVARTARHVWEECVQLHGAIGMTQEYVLGQYVKRLAVACTLYGGVEDHLEILAAQSLDSAPSTNY